MASNMSNINASAARVRPQGGNPYGAYPQGARPQARPAAAPEGKKGKGGQKPPVQKNRRKEKDYFFIMRRGVCLLIMVLALVWLAVIALNYVAILPQYTSFLIVPDLTPESEREEVDTGKFDDEGNAIIETYQDQSVYISMLDPVFGVLKKLVGLEMADADGNSMSAFYDSFSPALAGAVEGEVDDEATEDADKTGDEAEEEAAPESRAAANQEADEEADKEGDAEGEATDEEAEAAEDEGVKFGTVPAKTNINPTAREEDSMGSIAALVFDYAPLILLVGAIFAILAFLFALFSLFGRRIFKGFGLMSIVMLIGGLAMFIAGMAAMGNYMGNPSYDAEGAVVSVLDLSKLASFAMGALQGAPAEPLDPELDAQPLTMVAGYGLLIIVIIPVVMLILSLFARKKVPYSIFDK